MSGLLKRKDLRAAGCKDSMYVVQLGMALVMGGGFEAWRIRGAILNRCLDDEYYGRLNVKLGVEFYSPDSV